MPPLNCTIAAQPWSTAAGPETWNGENGRIVRDFLHGSNSLTTPLTSSSRSC